MVRRISSGPDQGRQRRTTEAKAEGKPQRKLTVKLKATPKRENNNDDVNDGDDGDA